MRIRTGQGDRRKIVYKENPLLLEQRYEIPTKSDHADGEAQRPRAEKSYGHKDKRSGYANAQVKKIKQNFNADYHVLKEEASEKKGEPVILQLHPRNIEDGRKPSPPHDFKQNIKIVDM